MKSRFPFRLGAPSYVYPADILSNVERLAPVVDDIELLLFEVDDQSDLPSHETVEKLRALAKKYALTYTIHLPLGLRLATDGDLRHHSVQKARWVIRSTQALNPWAYVVHLDGTETRSYPTFTMLTRWRDQAARALEAMAEEIGHHCLLAVENLDNCSPTAFLPLLHRLPISLCVDIGHFLKSGEDPLPFLAENLDRTRVVHLHGSQDGRDHMGLHAIDPGLLSSLLDEVVASGYRGVLTLEVFTERDFFPSLAMVQQRMEGRLWKGN